MGTKIESKLSADLVLIKRRVESQAAKLDELGGNFEQNLGEVVRQKEEIKDLPHNILDRWEVYLHRKIQLVMDFPPRRLLWEKTVKAKGFIASFFLRPGIIKLRVVNFLLNITFLAVRVLTWAIFLALVTGAIILLIYGVDWVIEKIGELVESLRSQDPSEMPKGDE